MADRTIVLPEIVNPAGRLGRHVRHDPRSLAYQVQVAKVTPKTVFHERKIPVFDQGDLGSCTINAQLGVLGSAPFYDTLPADLKVSLSSPNVQKLLVQPLYREETRADPFDGAWEPDDTGSDGLSAAKLAKAKGWISGYQHITFLAAAHAAIQVAPFIVGSAWLTGMDYPTKEGIVQVTGTERGGHEYVCFGYDVILDLWWFYNSWSTAFGKKGTFAMSSADFTKLLANQGDATPFMPITQPAPVPTPTPVPPTPTPTPPAPPVDPLATFPYGLVDAWASRRSSWWPSYERQAADSYKTWRSGILKP